LDLLHDGAELTVEEITSAFLEEYEALFDIQTVSRKCNAYEKEGLLSKKKFGKTVVFSIDNSLTTWIKSNEDMLDALSFYQMAGNFGIIGNYLSEQLDHHNRTFRVKHSFCVHTLEEEILFDLLDAINKKTDIRLEIKSSKNGNLNIIDCTPLQIFTSTRSGRRFLCGYVKKSRRFTCYRLDTVKTVTLLGESEEYEELLERLERHRRYLWGVSFQGNNRHHLNRLTMKIQALEPSEQYIVERLKREGRGGTVTRIERNVYQYEIEVFDCNEVLPWIRTFIGRILSLECTDKSVEQRFYRDLRMMYRMYQIEED
ncbi:MAG: WYL domain-containing protein, partial [Lachnospiraceae bacterium]|nr:WYL domain-containing protein [Lachnospiraceae bacterium]